MAAIAVVVNATIAVYFLRKHLGKQEQPSPTSEADAVPKILVLVHLGFLAAVVALAHHPVAFLGLFLMFMGVTQAYERFQNPPIIKEALLVAFFLAGLVVLGGQQRWLCTGRYRLTTGRAGAQRHGRHAGAGAAGQPLATGGDRR